MTTLIDITGQKFGRLTVIRRCGTAKNGNALWLCQCRCGNQTKADSYALRHGRARSCGCLTRESRSQLIRRNPKTAASMGRLSNLKIHDHHTDLPSRLCLSVIRVVSSVSAGIAILKNGWRHFSTRGATCYTNRFSTLRTLFLPARRWKTVI